MPDPNDAPATIAETLGEAGPCPTIKWAGKTYMVGWATPEVLADVELKALRPIYTPDEYAAEQQELRTALVVRKAHRAGSALWNAAAETAVGLLLILWACVRRHRPEFTPDDAARMAADEPDDTKLVIGMVSPGFFRIAGKAAKADPAKVEAAIQGMRATKA